jgi:hypothetical protein
VEPEPEPEVLEECPVEPEPVEPEEPDGLEDLDAGLPPEVLDPVVSPGLCSSVWYIWN